MRTIKKGKKMNCHKKKGSKTDRKKEEKGGKKDTIEPKRKKTDEKIKMC